ncbi:hypothetical protein H2198_008583 [Neophaeococcomyces mojaviensis]|uniref:Uncharacterized protein n=1 Tax=Neophaeococcomyces mojaviensis TaxID=3383035 RepID=A0ACC2ZXI8_9EURO|nr:hypothetical protein H2198_008583 [Knufia sp. JES_112]
MPRRWLSVRGRKAEQNTNHETGEARFQNGFDFAFTLEPHVFVERHNLAELESLRATTSGGEGYRSKQKSDPTLPIERPRSSECTHRNDKPSSAARLDDSQIGLALGSPRHPPQEFNTIISSISPAHQQHAPFLEHSLPVQTMNTKKWKKIGGFFRPRANSNKEPRFYRVQYTDAEVQQLGLPISRNHGRTPELPLIPKDDIDASSSDVEVPPPIEKDNQKFLMCTTHTTEDIKASGTTNEAPSLQLDIPGTPLDRYSVMFRDVHGMKQSGLLSRRSKTFEQLSINTNREQKIDNLAVPRLARRATSPTTSQPQCSSTTSTSQPCIVSKYSLFPTTPTSSKSQCPTTSPNQFSSHSLTMLSQSMPLHSTCPNDIARSDGHNTSCQGDEGLPQLSDNATGLTEPVLPFSRPAHTTSRASSESEIFFDVKSFRDSNSTVGQQFEMTRPPSAAVQLARSKSNARKILQDPIIPVEQTNEAQDDNENDQPSRTTSVQIDEAIAIVESLTSLSTSPLRTVGPPEPPALLPPHMPNVDGSHIASESVMLVMDTETLSKKKFRRRSLKTRLECLSIDVPSPVREAAEEITPKTTHSASAATVTTERIIPAHISHVASRALTPTQSTPSSTPIPTPSITPASIERSPSSPPAIKIKDSKFIPLSKYAPKHTTEDLARQTGLRPVRPARSNTDNLASYNSQMSSLRRPQRPERSSTMPAPLAHAPTPKQTLPPPVVAGPGSTGNGSRDMPTMIAYVKPAAEVSIARTVSLSRRPSAKVVVPRHVKTTATTATHQQSGQHVKSKPTSRPSEAPLTRAESKRRVEQSALGGREKVEEEVNEKKVLVEKKIPVVQEVSRRHKPGVSMDIVLEIASISPAKHVPPMPRLGDLVGQSERAPLAVSVS